MGRISQLRPEIGHTARHGLEFRIVGLGNLDAGLLVNRDDEVQQVHRIDVDLFPKLDVRRSVSFVHDGKVLTSQGGARSYDVAMYLVDHLYGESVARGVGRGMAIDWPDPDLEFVVETTPGDD